MKLSEIKQILAENNLRLTRSLGQNFLHDQNQLRRIIAAAELKKSDKILEIGPGLGPLTGMLLENAGDVLAIEKDARLIEFLKNRFEKSAVNPAASRLHLIHDDALKYLKREQQDWSGWKLVSNLPYSVASPILVELAQAKDVPRRLVCTLQIDVARRLMAKPGQPDYGLLTLLVQVEYKPERWFKIPASCFFPEPEVDSACICLARREQPLLEPQQKELFTRIVKRSFSQRRKMMLKLLKEEWDSEVLLRAFDRLNLPSQIRAEAVELSAFVELSKHLSQ